MADFSALFKRYALNVFRFALYLSGNRHEAEDITSETFVRAWTSPERIGAATVKAYLFTIARNLFLQELRKSRAKLLWTNNFAIRSQIHTRWRSRRRNSTECWWNCAEVGISSSAVTCAPLHNAN